MKKKRNIAARLGVVALVLTLVTTSLTAGTLAKYTEAKTAEATAYIAAFSFDVSDTVSGSKQVWSQDHSFAMEASNYKDDKDYTVGGSTAVLAPGAKGSIPIMVDLSGTEVAVLLEANIKLKDANTFPEDMRLSSKYSINGGTQQNGLANQAFPTDPSNDGKTALLNSTLILPEAETAEGDPSDNKVDILIEWEWSYEGSGGDTAVKNRDKRDTDYAKDLANGSISNPAMVIEIVATQAPFTE